MLGQFGSSNPVVDSRILFHSHIGLWVPKVTWITFRRWFSWFVVSGLCFCVVDRVLLGVKDIRSLGIFSVVVWIFCRWELLFVLLWSLLLNTGVICR